MTEFSQTAVLGAGVIGASWAALFLAAGRRVAVYDPTPNIEASVTQYITTAWPVLEQLGLTTNTVENVLSSGVLTFHATAVEAVTDATFIQESVPERLPVKHALYADIENHIPDGAVVASSASGLTLSEMQAGWRHPSRLVLGHPFNPPHLIPLVEVMGNASTDDDAVTKAQAFYRSIGKVTIRVRREVPGHVANRLQAAVWREAIHMISTGVATVEDVDTAMWAGPGLRWAAMGPTQLFHLGAGEGGLEAFCERYTNSFNRWWDDLGELHLTPEIAAQLVEGINEAVQGESHNALTARRDDMLTAMQVATARFRDSGVEN